MLKQFRPTTAGQRHLILTTRDELTREGKNRRAAVKPEKTLLVKKTSTNGRNHHGHITCRHKGGAHKRFYRIIDYKRDKEKVPARVASVEYDPNRTAFIALLNYADGEKGTSWLLKASKKAIPLQQMMLASSRPVAACALKPCRLDLSFTMSKFIQDAVDNSSDLLAFPLSSWRRATAT